MMHQIVTSSPDENAEAGWTRFRKTLMPNTKIVRTKKGATGKWPPARKYVADDVIVIRSEETFGSSAHAKPIKHCTPCQAISNLFVAESIGCLLFLLIPIPMFFRPCVNLALAVIIPHSSFFLKDGFYFLKLGHSVLP